MRLGGIPSRHSRSMAASVFAVASRVRARVPAQRASLSSPGPSIEIPTSTLYCRNIRMCSSLISTPLVWMPLDP